MTERAMTRQEKWRQRHPVAAWAHSATRSAIRRGLIQREPCAVCGDENAEAHHGDYSSPLVVTWYCRKHHKAHHAAEKAGRAQTGRAFAEMEAAVGKKG